MVWAYSFSELNTLFNVLLEGIIGVPESAASLFVLFFNRVYDADHVFVANVFALYESG